MGRIDGLAAALIYFAVRVHLGWSVWWDFFLLLENRTVPVGVAVLGVTFVTAAIHLGHHLHRPARRRTARLRPTHTGPEDKQSRGDDRLGRSSPRDGGSPGAAQ